MFILHNGGIRVVFVSTPKERSWI